MDIRIFLAEKFFIVTCGAQISAYSLWYAIPKHELLMNDPSMMFAHIDNPPSSLESDTYLIINGTKWPIMGGMNQTLNTGVK